VANPPEMLLSRFRVTHGMLVSLLQRGQEERTRGSGYRLLIDLVDRCHDDARRKRSLRRDAARVFRSLRRAGLVQRVYDVAEGSASAMHTRGGSGGGRPRLQ